MKLARLVGDLEIRGGVASVLGAPSEQQGGKESLMCVLGGAEGTMHQSGQRNLNGKKLYDAVSGRE